MPSEDINKKEFDEGTLLKLDIFRKCFREWLPVFLYTKGIEGIYIYDLFAGSGYDSKGYPGSPIILLQEARGNAQQYCLKLRDTRNLTLWFGFNEKNKEKAQLLTDNVSDFLTRCSQSCKLASTGCCRKEKIMVMNKAFSDIIQREQFRAILNNPRYAKFIILDQYGVKEVNENVFKDLISAPKTDFIFFISSSTIRRFAEHPAIKKYFETTKIDFSNSSPKDSHRLIADYYRSLIPPGVEYYLHSFTIRKESNYYGLIFGSSHSFGMEKFLRVCWQEDPASGDSNCNIDNDWPEDSLFASSEEPHKKHIVKSQLKQLILDEKITSNKEGLLYALKQGCEPKIYVEVIEGLIKEGLIEIEGDFNRTSSKIHAAKQYAINVLKRKNLLQYKV